jgi:hypothetical protein
MLARSVRASIDRFLLPALAGPLRLVPLTALATEKLSPIALGVAAKRGRATGDDAARPVVLDQAVGR